MKRSLRVLLAVCLALTAFCVPTFAVEHDFSGPGAGLFSDPTSDNTVYVATHDDMNIDRSKTAAIIPPTFGSPTVYMTSAGDLLTPNLVSGNSITGIMGVTVFPPSILTMAYPPYWTGWAGTNYTDVTADLYYSGGQLGTLWIPAIGLTVKVYQGTDSATLAKGAGHFPNTSIWDGNIAIAAHNRGVSNHFGQIHTLTAGNTIAFTTRLGTRNYEVCSVSKISVDDTTILDATGENVVTLITCVMNEPQSRWCVKAIEKP